MDAESDETTGEGCNFITSVNESEFAVLVVNGVSQPKNKVTSITASVKNLEVINAARGKIPPVQSNFFKATVHTGSPASFVNKRKAEYIVKSVSSAVVLDEKECPIDTVYVDNIRKCIELFGTL